jgi:putative transposase
MDSDQKTNRVATLAYKNFFEKRAGFPKFKSKHGRQSLSYPSHVKIDGDYLKLPGKIGLIYCAQDRKFDGQIKTVTVSQNPDGKYYASVLVDDGREIPPPAKVGKAIGIDLGLTHFCITSDGSKFDNPRHTKRYARNLKKKQQSLARKQKGSNTRAKARKLVARIHSKISRLTSSSACWRSPCFARRHEDSLEQAQLNWFKGG